MVVVRLNDSMGDLGDVLIRLNLHGVASNRVRVGIGHVGGGPADDTGAGPTPAPQTPPPPTPGATPNPYTDPAFAAGPDGVRFLEQATWGPTPGDLAHIRNIGFAAYLNEQLNGADTGYPTLPLFPVNNNAGCPNDPNNPATRPLCLRDHYSMYPVQLSFYQKALTGPDQLRQRVAFAFSEIIVTSGLDVTQPSWMTPYLQILDREAFGNYRQILYDITLNPAMGRYLDMAGNTKVSPNENYGREVLQLFSVGLNQLNPDGTLKLDPQGNAIPTYDQATITNFARVFTGWVIPVASSPQGAFDYINPMVVSREINHDTDPKTLLNGTVLPANQTSTQDLNAAIDNIFNHPNIGPFIGKQLIQHLVTSNPSPAYVQRVAAVFNNNRTNPSQLREVITAILLDPEARGDVKTDPDYGHLREPALYITGILRAFNASSDGYLNPLSAAQGQDIYRAPTVFNYFQPGYQVPGTTILGPEVQILDTTSGLLRANMVNQLVYRNPAISPGGNAPSGTTFDWSAWAQANAPTGDPQQLADALNAFMLHGAMSGGVRASIAQAMSSIPTSDPQAAAKRAQAAVYLVASSSQYQVER
jgi:hypothetical protein